MSKKQKYNVFYNESFNCIESFKSESTHKETTYSKHIGVFSKKTIKRIKNILKHKSLSLSELQYMIRLDAKFKYDFVFNRLFSYTIGSNKVRTAIEFKFPSEEKPELPESESIYLSISNEPKYQSIKHIEKRLTQESEIEEVINAVCAFSIPYTYNN